MSDGPARRASDFAPPRTRLDRMRDWWWIFGALCFVCGGMTAGFYKFTIYYLAEQSSVLTLQALSASSVLTATRLGQIDVTLRDQHYTDQTIAGTLADLAAHVHALDVRADGDRTKITDALNQQDKNSQQILLLLEPKPPTRR